MNTIALRMENISKSFGPVQALKNVTFTAEAGAVHALCGENGAGKSTLMKILSGVYTPDGGAIYVEGRKMDFKLPGDALAAGISMLYQELDLAEHMTVYENIFLGRELMRGIKIDSRAMREMTAELLGRYNFNISPTATISSLTMGECQIVELMKALMRQSQIIVMDEPTSSLSEVEASSLFKIIHQLRSEGMAIIYISHRMEEVMALADHISILRDGEVVHSAPRSELDIRTIVRHMVGRELNDFYPKRQVDIGEVWFEAENLSSDKGVKGVSFQVRRGEIVGMAGLVGAGRSETANIIFGVDPMTGGKLKLGGKEITVKSPEKAIAAGMAYLTEDRKRSGLWTNLPCSWNISMPNLSKIGMKHIISPLREHLICCEYGENVKVKWSSPDAPADSLSGGNQQKVLIARWLLADSEFIIFDEPTRGIDVGAKKEVYQILNELAARGKAILVISSELPELIGICDRILVMRSGELCGEFTAAEVTPEKIMHLAATAS